MMDLKKWPEPTQTNGPGQRIDANYCTTETEILQILRNSRTPVYIEYLCRVTGKTNREVRRIIQRLRVKGNHICSAAAQSGYYIGTEEEAKAFKAAQIRRARSIMRTCSAWTFGDEEGEQQLEFKDI